jgi:hypothetical protein
MALAFSSSITNPVLVLDLLDKILGEDTHFRMLMNKTHPYTRNALLLFAVASRITNFTVRLSNPGHPEMYFQDIRIDSNLDYLMRLLTHSRFSANEEAVNTGSYKLSATLKLLDQFGVDYTGKPRHYNQANIHSAVTAYAPNMNWQCWFECTMVELVGRFSVFTDYWYTSPLGLVNSRTLEPFRDVQITPAALMNEYTLKYVNMFNVLAFHHKALDNKASIKALKHSLCRNQVDQATNLDRQQYRNSLG